MALTPLNRRRLANFRANRRGWWSLWIFVVLLVLTLAAELIANDKPLLVRYDLAGVKKSLSREALARRPQDLWRYRELLPVRRTEDIVSLGEAVTPIVA